MFDAFFNQPMPRIIVALASAQPHLSASEMNVLICLLGRAYSNGGVPFPASTGQLAFETGLSLPPIGAALRRMAKIGVIERVADRHGKQAASYRVIVEALEALGGEKAPQAANDDSPMPVRKRTRRK